MKWLDRLSRFFFAPMPMPTMAICRLTLGLSVFLHYASSYSNFETYWGPESIAGATFYERITWAMRLGRATTENLDWLYKVHDPSVFYGIYSLLLLMSLWFAFGFYTRTAGVVVLILHSLLHANNEFLFWGWAELIKPFLLYCILASPGRWYSLDGWMRERRWAPKNGAWLGPAWPVRLFQIHVTTVYIVVAWTRIDDPNWLNGSMVHGILTDSIFSRFDSDFWNIKELIRLTCYSAWALEFIAPVALWFRCTKRITAISLILMHLGLEMLTQVGYWNFIMIAALTHFLIPQFIEKYPLDDDKV